MKEPKLTRKQKNFADKILADPKKSATQAVRETYGRPGKELANRTAEQIAYENMRKPSVVKYLELHKDKAENTMIEVMDYSRNRLDDKGYARLALDSSNAILDRVVGKPTTLQETNTYQQINITLGSTPQQVISEQ